MLKCQLEFYKFGKQRKVFQFSPVAQSCLTLCNPMDCSTPGFPIHHQLPELAQSLSENVTVILLDLGLGLQWMQVKTDSTQILNESLILTKSKSVLLLTVSRTIPHCIFFFFNFRGNIVYICFVRKEKSWCTLDLAPALRDRPACSALWT